MSAKLTSQELKDKANKNNPDVQIIGKYINSKTNIYVICKCGNTTSVRPSELYKSWRCFECGIKARKYINGNGGWSTKRNKEAKNRIIQKHKELLSKKLPHIELVGDYEDSKTKTNYICFKVGLTLYKYNDVTKCIKNRFRKENNNILLLGYIIFKNGAEGYELEQRILNSHQKYNSDILQFGGNSELLSENIIALDKYKFIKTKEII